MLASQSATEPSKKFFWIHSDTRMRCVSTKWRRNSTCFSYDGRMAKIFLLVASVFLVNSFTPWAYGDDVVQIIFKKQEEKRKTRWSLAEWLETRDRMMLMDLWLAMHSPTPYEFYLGTDYQMSETDQSGDENYWRIYGAAYATIFGLGLEYETSPSKPWSALFLLRVFGFNAQATNITLQLGVRNSTQPEVFRNAVLGVGTTIYIAKYFGVDGFYRHYFDSTPNATGSSLSGHRFEVGAFIDFSLLRVYGNYYDEPLSSPSGQTGASGVNLGARVYF